MSLADRLLDPVLLRLVQVVMHEHAMPAPPGRKLVEVRLPIAPGLYSYFGLLKYSLFIATISP